METVKKNIALSERHNELFRKTEAALRVVSEQIIDQAISTNTYLVLADKNGKIIEVPAKDLQEQRNAAKG